MKSKKKLIKDNLLLYITISIFVLFLPLKNICALEYKGVGGRPAYPRKNNPRTQSIFIHTIYPSDKIKDAIKVINNSDETKSLLLYPVDSIISTGGAFACAQYVEPRKKVGSWIKLKKSRIILPPHSYKIIPFVINIPLGVDIGEHNGCLVIQENKKVKKNKKQGITLSLRTAIRVALTVPGKIKKELKIKDYNIKKLKNKKIILQPIIENTGNVSIDSDINVLVYDIWGNIADFHGGEFTILRDKEIKLNFKFKKPFFGGWFKSYYTSEYDGSINSEMGQKNQNNILKLKSKTINFFVLPSWLGFIIELLIILLLLFLLYVFYKYRKFKNWIKKDWINYKVQFGDNIQLLSDKFKIKWKTLAKANKIPPPYILKKGQNLKVPPQLPKNENINNYNK
jgi:hypothetical protein